MSDGTSGGGTLASGGTASPSATISEPGWYFVDGDPPGTVRRWNGVEWIGFPQRDPNVPRILSEPVVIDSGPGQHRLYWWGLLAQIALLIPAAGYAILSYTMWREAGTVSDLLTSDVFDMTQDEFTDRFETFLFGAQIASIGQLIAGPLFVIWFYLAYRNLSKLIQVRRRPAWAIVGWFVPFANLFFPGSMMSDLVHGSPSRHRAGAINPILPNVWWGLYILPNMVMPLLAIWAIRTLSVNDLRLIYFVLAAVVTLTFISALLALVLIERVTKEQDMRLSPNS